METVKIALNVVAESEEAANRAACAAFARLGFDISGGWNGTKWAFDENETGSFDISVVDDVCGNGLDMVLTVDYAEKHDFNIAVNEALRRVGFSVDFGNGHNGSWAAADSDEESSFVIEMDDEE